MPPDRDPFNPPLSDALLASNALHVGAQDGLTHYLDNRAGRTVARCGATGGTRLTLKWELGVMPGLPHPGGAEGRGRAVPGGVSLPLRREDAHGDRPSGGRLRAGGA